MPCLLYLLFITCLSMGAICFLLCCVWHCHQHRRVTWAPWGLGSAQRHCLGHQLALTVFRSLQPLSLQGDPAKTLSTPRIRTISRQSCRGPCQYGSLRSKKKTISNQNRLNARRLASAPSTEMLDTSLCMRYLQCPSCQRDNCLNRTMTSHSRSRKKCGERCDRKRAGHCTKRHNEQPRVKGETPRQAPSSLSSVHLHPHTIHPPQQEHHWKPHNPNPGHHPPGP